MKKLFKGKFKIILPILMATVALVFAVTSVMGATGDVVISNTLLGSADVLPSTSAVSLEWSTTDYITGFSPADLPLELRMGETEYVWVKATNNESYTILRTLFLAEYDRTVISVEGAELDGSGNPIAEKTWVLGEYGANVSYWGPIDGFPMVTGMAVVRFTITPLKVDDTTVSIYAVQLP